jgi:hypothetical protein
MSQKEYLNTKMYGTVEIEITDLNGKVLQHGVTYNAISDAYQEYAITQFLQAMQGTTYSENVSYSNAAAGTYGAGSATIYLTGNDTPFDGSTFSPPDTTNGLTPSNIVFQSSTAESLTNMIPIRHRFDWDKKKFTFHFRKTTGAGTIKSIYINRNTYDSFCYSQILTPYVDANQTYPTWAFNAASMSDDANGGIQLAPYYNGGKWWTAFRRIYAGTPYNNNLYDWSHVQPGYNTVNADQFAYTYQGSNSYQATAMRTFWDGGIIAPNSNNQMNFPIRFYNASSSGTNYNLYATLGTNASNASGTMSMKTLIADNGGTATTLAPVCVFNYDEGRFELFVTVATSPYIEVQRLILAKPAALATTSLYNAAGTYTPLVSASTPKVFQCKHPVCSDGGVTTNNVYRKAMYGSCINGKYYLPCSHLGAETTYRYGIVMDAEDVADNTPTTDAVPVLDYYLARRELGGSYHRGIVRTQEGASKEMFINLNAPTGLPLLINASNWMCGTVLETPYVKPELAVMNLYYTINIGEPPA